MSCIETVNSQIISAVVKWGAITHEDLHYYLDLKTQLSTLRGRTHTLIKNKVLKSIKLMNQKKPILYTYEGTKLLAGDDIKICASNQLPHDSVLSNICIRILQLNNVFDVNTVKEDESNDKFAVVPDAEALVLNGDGSINIAIEYEATQKSKSRIVYKFLSYSQNNDFKYVLYFFNNEREAVVYANTLYTLEQSKLPQHSALIPKKFYFFVRNQNKDMDNFLKSFKPIYPSDIDPLLTILNGQATVH